MTWTFYRDGKPESVEKEKWCWEAVYTDGTILKQFDDDGIFHQFEEIDQCRLFAFRMTDDVITHTMLFEQGMKLIHFYREYRLNVGTQQFKAITLYVFGHEIDGKKQLFVITDKGLIITDDDERVRVF